MASIVRCLLRNCFENEHNQDDGDDEISPSTHDFLRIGARLRGYYHPPSINAGETSVGEEDDGTAASFSTNAEDVSAQEGGSSLLEMFRMFSSATIRPYEAVSNGESPPMTPPLPPSPLTERQSSLSRIVRRSNSTASQRDGITPSASLPARPPPLHAATSFQYRSESEIPVAIALDEVVLPGSDLQKQMAVQMAADLEDQGDECVICMEGFDASNPRMPTLCGCGENKTYFHLPCLYQWIEQDRNCPSCRKRLRWEEF